jgi:hypothetical protein
MSADQTKLKDYSFTPVLNYPVARFSVALRVGVGSPQSAEYPLKTSESIKNLPVSR